MGFGHRTNRPQHATSKVMTEDSTYGRKRRTWNWAREFSPPSDPAFVMTSCGFPTPTSYWSAFASPAERPARSIHNACDLQLHGQLIPGWPGPQHRFAFAH